MDDRLNIDPQIEQLVGYYRRALELVVQRLQNLDPATLTAAKQRALLSEISRILQSLDEHAGDWLREHVPALYAQGQAAALVSIGQAASLNKAVDIVAASGIVNEGAVKFLVQDAHDSLLTATQNVSLAVKKAVRDVAAEHLRAAQITGDKASTAGKQLAADLSRINAPIIDKAGKRWDLQTYADTVARSKLAEAHREGAMEKAVTEGFDLARISAHGAKDACRNFEGALVSLTGQTPGYPTLSQLKSSGLIFHPRCKHLVQPLNPKLLPDSVRQHADDMAAQVEEALKLAEEGKMNSHGMKKGA